MAPTTPAGSRQAAVTLGLISRTALSRECILKQMASEPDLNPLDLGSGGDESVDRARSADPDIVLVDLPPNDACHLVEALLEVVPGTRPVAIHRSLGTEELVRLAESGFVGFISTDSGIADVLRELRAVLRQEPSCTPQLAGALIRCLRKRPERSDDHLGPLTARERQVALLLERHFSNKEIASELGIEVGTVKNHVHSILTKLGLQNRWALTRGTTQMP